MGARDDSAHAPDVVAAVMMSDASGTGARASALRYNI